MLKSFALSNVAAKTTGSGFAVAGGNVDDGAGVTTGGGAGVPDVVVGTAGAKVVVAIGDVVDTAGVVDGGVPGAVVALGAAVDVVGAVVSGGDGVGGFVRPLKGHRAVVPPLHVPWACIEIEVGAFPQDGDENDCCCTAKHHSGLFTITRPKDPESAHLPNATGGSIALHVVHVASHPVRSSNVSEDSLQAIMYRSPCASWQVLQTGAYDRWSDVHDASAKDCNCTQRDTPPMHVKIFDVPLVAL